MALRSAETWDALSSAYRKRLERSGITRERYLSGDPLTGARGHAKTPEHPERAYRKPGKYPEYVQKRTGKAPPRFSDQVVTDRVKKILMDEFMAGRLERIDITTIAENVRMMDTQTRIEVMGMTGDEYRDRARAQVPKGKRKPPAWFYQDGTGTWVNPFWYH
jgi:hypothetical protein